jgi:hypothetical protein
VRRIGFAYEIRITVSANLKNSEELRGRDVAVSLRHDGLRARAKELQTAEGRRRMLVMPRAGRNEIGGREGYRDTARQARSQRSRDLELPGLPQKY